MKLKKFMLVPAMAMVLLFPTNCLAGPVAPSVATEYAEASSPRYTYISNAVIGIDGDSSNADTFISVTGYDSVTKITGTLTLYKVSSSGTKTKVTSWNLSATGNELYVEKSASISGAGNYSVSFSGKVYAGSNSESITISSKTASLN